MIDQQLREKVMKYMQRSLRIELVDGRIIIGIFQCFDQHSNIILKESVEHRTFGEETEVQTRVLGMTLILGKYIVSCHAAKDVATQNEI